MVGYLESVLILLVPFLLDLLAGDASILVQLVIHIGLPRPPPLSQLLQQQQPCKKRMDVVYMCKFTLTGFPFLSHALLFFLESVVLRTISIHHGNIRLAGVQILSEVIRKSVFDKKHIRLGWLCQASQQGSITLLWVVLHSVTSQDISHNIVLSHGYATFAVCSTRSVPIHKQWAQLEVANCNKF